MNKDKNILDMVNAGAYYIANRAGAYGGPDMNVADIGVGGATQTDLFETESMYKDGKINQQQYKNEVASIYKASAVAIIRNLIDKGIDAVANFVTMKFPVIAAVVAPVVNVVKSFVYGAVEKKVVNTASRVFKWIKEKLFG